MRLIRRLAKRIAAKWKRLQQRNTPFAKWTPSRINREASRIIQSTPLQNKSNVFSWTIQLIQATQARRDISNLLAKKERETGLGTLDYFAHKEGFSVAHRAIERDLHEAYAELIRAVGRAEADRIVKEVHTLDSRKQ